MADLRESSNTLPRNLFSANLQSPYYKRAINNYRLHTRRCISRTIPVPKNVSPGSSLSDYQITL